MSSLSIPSSSAPELSHSDGFNISASLISLKSISSTLFSLTQPYFVSSLLLPGVILDLTFSLNPYFWVVGPAHCDAVMFIKSLLPLLLLPCSSDSYHFSSNNDNNLLTSLSTSSFCISQFHTPFFLHNAPRVIFLKFSGNHHFPAKRHCVAYWVITKFLL